MIRTFDADGSRRITVFRRRVERSSSHRVRSRRHDELQVAHDGLVVQIIARRIDRVSIRRLVAVDRRRRRDVVAALRLGRRRCWIAPEDGAPTAAVSDAAGDVDIVELLHGHSAEEIVAALRTV